MKLCLLLLLAAASAAMAGPVPRTNMGRSTDQEDQGRLFPLAIFNNGVTTSSTSTTVKPVVAALASAVVAAAAGVGVTGQTAAIPGQQTAAMTAGQAAPLTVGQTAPIPAGQTAPIPVRQAATIPAGETAAISAGETAAKPAVGGAVVPAAEPVAPTRNALQGLQPISVDDLPPANQLAEMMNQQQAGTPGIPSLPNALSGLANFLNPLRLLGLNNLAAAKPPLSQTGVQAGGEHHPGVYIWSPAGGAVPINLGNRKRVLDEPEQIDPNYLRLLQQLYYSSRQNLQQSSYIPPQFSNSIEYPSPVGYTNPIPDVNPYSQPQLSAYQPYVAPSVYSASPPAANNPYSASNNPYSATNNPYSASNNPYSASPPAANNPYYPLYFISVPLNSDANIVTQNQNSVTDSGTFTQKENKPGIVGQDTAVKVQTENVEAKPEIGVKEIAVKVDTEKKDNSENKSETEIKKTSGSKVEKVPNQKSGTDQGKTHNTEINQQAAGIKSGTEQGKTHNTEINQQAAGIIKDTNSNGSEMINQSEPSNARENSKFYVKFSRDPTTQQRRVYQEHQSRSDAPPHEDSHGQLLVSSYRLQHTSAR